MRDTLGLTIGPHLAFKDFMADQKAEMHEITSHLTPNQGLFHRLMSFSNSYKNIPNGYKYYISESCFYYPAMARKTGRINGKIIDVCASSIYYYLYTNKINGVNKGILLELLRNVDGFICEGNYIKEILIKLGIEVPTATVYTYVNQTRFRLLSSMSPNLKTKNIAITATTDYFYKGLDILLEALKIVNEEDDEITLTIAPNRQLDINNITNLMSPNVKIEWNVEKMLKNTSLYVHPSRGDVFPMACLEPMVMGIPTIVSDQTGTKEIIEPINETYVTKIDKRHVANKILEYFSLSYEEKKLLSKKYKVAGKPFNKNQQMKIFREKYRKLIKQI